MNRITLSLLFIASCSIYAQVPPGQFIGPRNVDVKDFCITPSGANVYTAAQSRITLYEIFSGKHIHTIEYKKSGEIRSISLTSDSTCLVAGSDRGIIYVHNLLDNRVDSVKLSNNPVTSITVNAFNSRIASGTSEGEIILTDITGGSMERLKVHDNIITDLEFSRDGTRLMSSGMDGGIVVMDLSLEKPSFYYLFKKSSPCRDLSISSDDSGLLASYDNGKVYRWKINTDKTFIFQSGQPQRGWATGVEYHQDGRTWVSCTSSGRIRIKCTGATYKTKIKGIATRIKFNYKKEPILTLLVSIYKGGLIWVSATQMQMN
jgi:WD40 repeat protein